MSDSIYRGGSGNCGHVLHSVHMLNYNHIVIGKDVDTIVESQLAAFRFLKYQGQALAKHSISVVK